MIPRRGAFVARPDAAAIADMFAVRGRLEPLAARLAAQQATAADVAELRSLLELARTATERADFSRVAELNSELHLAVIGISGNKWLASISSALYLHVHWVFRIGAAHRAPHSWTNTSGWWTRSSAVTPTGPKPPRRRTWTLRPLQHWPRRVDVELALTCYPPAARMSGPLPSG